MLDAAKKQLGDEIERLNHELNVTLPEAFKKAIAADPNRALIVIDPRRTETAELADYHLAHSARADLCRRLGKTAEARASYERALALAGPEAARRFLLKRLNGLTGEA